MTIQYLLDEHIASLYRTQLLRKAPYLIVRRIGDPDAPPRGTLDPDILIWCERPILTAWGRGTAVDKLQVISLN